MTALPPQNFYVKTQTHVVNLMPYFSDVVVGKLSYICDSLSTSLLSMWYFSKLMCCSNFIIFLGYNISNAAIEYFWQHNTIF